MKLADQDLTTDQKGSFEEDEYETDKPHSCADDDIFVSRLLFSSQNHAVPDNDEDGTGYPHHQQT